MKEFGLIEQYFNMSLLVREDVALGIGDDAALLTSPPDTLIAASIDSMVEGIHFDHYISPKDLGYKSLAISLSDMAAMGAQPAWVMLALTLPCVDKGWLEDFSSGFFELIKAYNLQLIGGNTTQGNLSITTQIMGFLPKGTGVKRSGAKPGDLIYVTGSLGDAGLALHYLKHQQTSPDYFLSRLHHPTPRVKEGLLLRSLATSMIDISDGLAADLGHVLEKSGVGATLQVEKIPLSDGMKHQPISSPFAYQLALSSGDDYELCFTINPHQRDIISEQLPRSTCIGIIESSAGLKLLYQNQPFELKTQGYQHFEQANPTLKNA